MDYGWVLQQKELLWWGSQVIKSMLKSHIKEIKNCHIFQTFLSLSMWCKYVYVTPGINYTIFNCARECLLSLEQPGIDLGLDLAQTWGSLRVMYTYLHNIPKCDWYSDHWRTVLTWVQLVCHQKKCCMATKVTIYTWWQKIYFSHEQE